MISWILSLVATFIVIYVSRFYYRYYTRVNPLPGPFPLPFVGNLHQSVGIGFNDFFTSLHKKYGDVFEVYLAGNRNVVLCRANLTDKLNNPSTKSNFFTRFHITEGFVEYDLYGAGTGCNNDLESWKYNRQFFDQTILAPEFNNQAIQWVNELCKEMESYWNDLGENQELDLSRWMHAFTNEIIYKIATGIKNNSVANCYNSVLDSNNALEGKKVQVAAESVKFVKAIETYVRGLMYLTIFNQFVRHYVPFIRGRWKEYLKNKDYVLDKLDKVVIERRAEIENTPLDQPLRHDMLTSYITANTSRDINKVKRSTELLRPVTHREIRAMILDSLLGGTETVANTFCFAVYYLGRYPEVKQKLRRELDAVLDKDLTKPITFEQLEQLHYCEAVINEVFRHCPISFIMHRINTESDHVAGYDWPKSTLFIMLFSSIMKHKENWTDPDKFDPDRFYKVEESDTYLLEKQKPRHVFPMFGGGIRICPGKKLAMIELKCLMTYHRKYDIEMADKNAPLNLRREYINTAKDLIIKVKPRKF